MKHVFISLSLLVQASAQDAVTYDKSVGIKVDDPKVDLQVSGKIWTSKNLRGLPKKGLTGGKGDRLILSEGNGNAAPYSLGMFNHTFWSSVPAGAKFDWFMGGDLRARLHKSGKFEVLPSDGYAGFQVDSTNNGLGWDIVFYNAKCRSPFQLAGFRLNDDGHLEATNIINGDHTIKLRAISARMGSYGWTNVSDERRKEDVKPLSGLLKIARALQPVTFRFKQQFDRKTHIGFTAQNVEKFLPSLVEDDGDLKSLNYAVLSTVAIGAVQEQQKLIEDLRQENEDLKKRLERIEALLLKK